MSIPFVFGNQTGPIPLSELDDNFTYVTSAPTLTGTVTINAPVSGTGASLVVNSATNWQGIQCNSTVQVTGPNALTNANQNVSQTQLLFHGYAAEFVSINGSAGSNKKVWSNYADGSGNYNYRIEDDALSTTYTYMQVARSGNSGTFGSHQPIVSFPIGYGNVAISSTITAGVYQLAVSAGSVAGFSNGVFLSAGSNTSDTALNIVNGANSAVFFNIRGDGKTVMGPCLTANTTTFTVTGSASSTAPAATFGGTANNYITATDGAGMTAVVQTATGLGAVEIGASSNHAVAINSNNTTRILIASGGSVTVTGNFACNNVVPASQPTGYGTPTGGARQSSFAASTITLPNLAAAVAQLIIDLKGTGLIGS